MVTPKQMHLDSAQITFNNRGTFRTAARGVPGIVSRTFSGSFPHAAVAQSAHGSAFCPPDSARVCLCAPWIQTRTSPDAPSRTECAKLQTGILTALTHMCVRPFVRFSFGRNWREPSGGGPSRRVYFVIKHA